MTAFLSHFHFLSPDWLWMLVPLATIVIILLLSSKKQHSQWQTICDAALLPFLINNKQKKRLAPVFYWLSTVWVIVCLSLAGPTWSFKHIPIYESPASHIIVLDLSPSMNVTDVKPSRLMRARYKIIDILRRSRGIKTGLIVFAGDAYIVAPLTSDVSTIENIIPALSPAIMPTSKNNPASGLLWAKKLMMRAGVKANASVLLLTDSAGGPEALNKARMLKALGATLNVLGVGTPKGAPVSLNNGNFLTGANGELVLSRLKPQSLKALAAAGGGKYMTMTKTNADLDYLMPLHRFSHGSKLKKSRIHQGKFWKDQGPLFLLLVLPLALLAYRRGALNLFVGVLFPVALMGTPHVVHAQGLLDKLLYNQNQRGLQLLQQKKPKAAANIFTNPKWKAAALYKARQYQQSEALYKQQNDATSLYNQGNTLAKQGKFKAAIKHYQHSLKLNPNNKDATYNIALLKKLQKKSQHQKSRQKLPPQQKPKQNQSQQKQSHRSSNQKSQQKTPSTSPAPQKPQQKTLSSHAQKPKLNQSQTHQSSAAKHNNKAKNTSLSGNQKHTKNQSKPIKQPQFKSPSTKSHPNKTKKKHHPAEKDTLKNDSKAARKAAAWLKKIPDDPGGLLKREFTKEYYQRH